MLGPEVLTIHDLMVEEGTTSNIEIEKHDAPKNVLLHDRG